MKVYNKRTEPAYIARQRFQNELETSIYSLYHSNIMCNELSGDELNYVLRRLYKNGSILVTKAPESEIAKVYLGEDESTSFLVFSDYSDEEYGYMDLPTKVRPINPRGVPFIKNRTFTPNEDCVIIHATKNRVIPSQFVSDKITDIVNILMTIRTNLNALKQPYIVKTTGKKVSNAQAFMNALLSDEPLLFQDSNDSSVYAVTNLNVQSHVKELYEHALCLLNEIYTFLGIDNSGQTFKAEHLNSDEVNSNNVSVNIYSNNFKSALKEAEEAIESVLGAKIHFYTIAEKSTSIHNDIHEQGGNEDDNQQDKANQ